MKTTSSRQMAIYIAISASLVAGIAMIITNIFSKYPFWLLLVFSLLIVFSAIYLIVFYTLNSFIFEKINPIYKTIHNFNLPEKELKKNVGENDMITEVNREVLKWARNKTREIAQLKQMEKYRKDFLGNVSHELKTPIFNIQGYVLTLLDGGLEDTSINRLYLERTEKSINRMISIVEDLEAISRLESGELKLKIESVNLVKLIEDVFEMQEMRAKKMKIKLGFSYNYDKPLKVLADRERILEAVNNLIVNSIKYGKKHGKTTVSFLDMGEYVLTEINDNGIGIGENDIPRIFERFYRTPISRAKDQSGSGLGLAIVKHIIEAHNQTINVRSALNVGTSFAFTLKKS